MKKYLIKLSILATVALVLLMSCSKNDDAKVDEPISAYVLVTDELTPGDIVEIKSDKTLTFSNVDIVLNNTTIKAYKISDFSFVFTLPVIPPGKYSLQLPTIDKNLILDLNVKTYIPITNPTQVIATYIVTRNECFEEMKKNTSVVQSPTSPETLLMIDQIKQEWDYQYSQNNEKDKELLAYVLQKQKISPEWFKVSNDLPANYYNKISATASDTGDKLVSIAKTFVTYQVLAVGSIPFVIGSGGLFTIAPNPFTAVFFLVSFSSYVVSKEAARRRAMDVGSLKGVAEELTNFSAQKTAALQFSNNVEKKIGISVKFRNLKNSDAAIHPDIQASFSGESELVLKDNEVKSLYQKALQFTEKLKGSFLSYSPAIGTTSERSMVLPVAGSEIIVKGSSEPIITISSKMVGIDNLIKVSSTSTQDVNFNLKIAYKRKIDGKEIVKDIACIYKPSSPCDDTATSYPTVTIGGQVWMQKNLNVCKYRNGDDIPQVQDQTAWAALKTGAWCYYENKTTNGTVYDKLYNWYAVKDPRGLAPAGYHIPTDAEWTTLTTFLGGELVAGKKMKAVTGWPFYPGVTNTNSSGFSGLPGGYRDTWRFETLTYGGNWWSASEVDTVHAWYRNLSYADDGYVIRNSTNKVNGFSVRCLKD